MPSQIYSEELIDQCRELFCCGYSFGEISRKLGVSYGSVRYRLMKQGVKPRTDQQNTRALDIAQVDSVLALHYQGKRLREIAALANVSASTISRCLSENGIVAYPSGQARQYNLNENYFHDVSSEEQAYWLGFLAADGCVYSRGNCNIGLALAKRDRDHLERFLSAIDSNYPIKEQRKSFRILVRSKAMVKDLGSYEVTPRKSLSLRWPCLPPNLVRHYMRGYVDGDGTFHISRTDDKLHFGVMGTDHFLEECREVLYKECNLEMRHKIAQAGKSRAFVYRCSGREQVFNIARFLYSDSTVCLSRKREVVRAYLKRYPSFAAQYPDLL